jgi:hypothetical protein
MLASAQAALPKRGKLSPDKIAPSECLEEETQVAPAERLLAVYKGLTKLFAIFLHKPAVFLR